MKEKRRRAKRISTNSKITQNQKNHRKDPYTPLRPILLIEKLDENFGRKSIVNPKKSKTKVSKEEEILLTSIANIIVEIIIRDEL